MELIKSKSFSRRILNPPSAIIPSFNDYRLFQPLVSRQWFSSPFHPLKPFAFLLCFRPPHFILSLHFSPKTTSLWYDYGVKRLLWMRGNVIFNSCIYLFSQFCSMDFTYINFKERRLRARFNAIRLRPFQSWLYGWNGSAWAHGLDWYVKNTI